MGALSRQVCEWCGEKYHPSTYTSRPVTLADHLAVVEELAWRRAESERHKSALEFYADAKSWERPASYRPHPCGGNTLEETFGTAPAVKDDGALARAALATAPAVRRDGHAAGGA